MGSNPGSFGMKRLIQKMLLGKAYRSLAERVHTSGMDDLSASPGSYTPVRKDHLGRSLAPPLAAEPDPDSWDDNQNGILSCGELNAHSEMVGFETPVVSLNDDRHACMLTGFSPLHAVIAIGLDDMVPTPIHYPRPSALPTGRCLQGAPHRILSYPIPSHASPSNATPE